MKEQNIAIDWDAQARLVAAAESKPDSLPAFLARCESLLFVAEAFHKSRHKQESFRPSWVTPQRE